MSPLPHVRLQDEPFPPGDQHDDSVMFTSTTTAVKILGYEGSDNLNISLQLRTFESSGLLLFHQFISGGQLCLSIKEGVVIADMMMNHSLPSLTMETFTPVNDGDWHEVGIVIERNTDFATLRVDKEIRMQKILMKIRTGRIFHLLMPPLDSKFKLFLSILNPWGFNMEVNKMKFTNRLIF